jgi:hypothetical protein
LIHPGGGGRAPVERGRRAGPAVRSQSARPCVPTSATCVVNFAPAWHKDCKTPHPLCPAERFAIERINWRGLGSFRCASLWTTRLCRAHKPSRHSRHASDCPTSPDTEDAIRSMTIPRGKVCAGRSLFCDKRLRLRLRASRGRRSAQRCSSVPVR